MASLIVVGCSSPEQTPAITEAPAEPASSEAVETMEVVDPTTFDALFNFEDGTTQGWEPHGETAVTVSADAANSGAQSIVVTERMETWHGAALDVSELMTADTIYNISAYVRAADGEPRSQFTLKMQQTPAGEMAVTTWLASSPFSGGDDPQWVRLGGEFTYSGAVDELLLVVESPSDELVDFYLDDVNIVEYVDPNKPVPMSPQTDIPSLHETFKDQFLMGAALEPYQLESEFHADLLTRHFNSVTPENVMKPVSIQPEEGEFTWDEADKLVEFARENGLAVHGHTLVWHQQAAEWMFADEEGNPLEPTEASKELVLQRLETHIRAITERYKDDINIWDVVNEAVDPAEEDCMRRSPWYELTGKEYIVTAFTVADEMLPDTTLIINDYSMTDHAKRECMVNLVQEMQADGVPIDGIGMQMHVNIENPIPSIVAQSIERFAELGEVHITEVDMSIYTNDTDSYNEVPEEIMVLQGYRYKELFEVFSQQAEHIDSITFWGMADDHTWLSFWPIDRINLPLLFDESLQAKHAYWGIMDPDRLPVLNVRLNVAKATPEIDGELDGLWESQPWIQLDSGDDLALGYQTRWDEENLYVFVMAEGTDYDLETIDLFIDRNNGKTQTYEGDEQHLIIQGGECVVCEGVVLAGAGDDTSHTLEIAISLSESVVVGDELGFDIRVTRASAPDSPVSWNDRDHTQDSDTSKYGILSLIEPAKMTTAVRGTPNIDAEEDDIWAEAETVETEVWVLGDSGATGTVKTMWDDEHLYVYFTVTDAQLSKEAGNPWEQDSIEVYVDQNNAKTTTYEGDDGQYRINFNNEQSFLGGATADKITSASRITDDGYVIELAILLDAIEPQEGMIIGFEFQVNNDEDGSGVRDSVVTWNDPTHLSYQNTSRFGLLQLGP